MATGSRIIILNKKNILLNHRIKNGQEYYVLQEGTMKKNESPKDTVIRETKEETNLNIELDNLLWKTNEYVKGKKKLAYYFLAKNFTGKLQLGGPEIKKQSPNNIYLLEWIPIEKLTKILLYPKNIALKIITKFNQNII